MYSSRLRSGIFVLFVAMTWPVLAQTDGQVTQSDWLELVKGYKGSTLGAEVVSIEDAQNKDDDERRLIIAIPKTSMRHPDEIEEVVVVGQMPEKAKPLELPELDISYEWLDDYDNDNYGLVIRLGSNTTWPIRLYMNSGPGFVR